MLVEADLPDDPALLRAMLVAARGEIAEQQALIADLEGAGSDARTEIKRLTAIIAAFQRHRFGARSEQLDPDQLALALEELDVAVARVRAEADVVGGEPSLDTERLLPRQTISGRRISYHRIGPPKVSLPASSIKGPALIGSRGDTYCCGSSISVATEAATGTLG